MILRSVLYTSRPGRYFFSNETADCKQTPAGESNDDETTECTENRKH